MKRIVIAIFAAGLVGLFAWLVVNRPGLSLSHSARQSAKTIIPSTDGTKQDELSLADENAAYDESKTQPLIKINPDETFIQALNVDINKDGTSDQICAIKKISESTICFAPAIQNPVTGEYTRLQEIRTGITQTRTLLFYTIDIIGDRNEALVFSGMTADNMQSLGVYLPSTGKDGKTVFTPAADLRADGSIAIQEIQRSDAYNLGLTNGDSYPIITYNSDPDSPDTLNQIERVYRWDKNLKRYEQTSQSKIEGKKIESRLVSQLQGGDVSSFEKFLSGVWYMPNQTGKTDAKIIYFAPEEQEIVFHSGTTEESFIRESGSARRYGAYLITHNRTIPNIKRFIDIELSGLDEISVRIQEDVKLKIGVASDWDGIYRKMTDNAAAPKSGTDQAIDALKKYLMATPGEWTASDGSSLGITGDAYRLNIASGAESGSYALLSVQKQTVIQMKSGKKSRFFVATVDPSKNLILTEVSVTIDGTNLAGPPPITFIRKR
jgi:hypothetical protein